MREKIRQLLKDNLTLVIFIVVMIVVRTAVVDRNYVSSGSHETYLL